MWKTLKSKVIFKHPRLTLIEDEIELPNGEKSDYLFFESKGDCVTIICRNNDGKIIVQKEFSYPVRKVLYQFPGGSIFPDEVLDEGANRELMEEVGYKANKLVQIGKYLVNNRKSKTLMYVFLVEDLEEYSLKENRDSTELDLENFWLSEKEIDNLIQNGEIINSNFLASWCIYKNFKNK